VEFEFLCSLRYEKKNEGTTMKAEDVFALGLGLSAPWGLLSQRLDMDTKPFELYLEVGAERGAKYSCWPIDCHKEY
jgi:hypothetical protein